MLTDDIREFLKKPLIGYMSAIDPKGYPHVLPVWFLLEGDDIMITSMTHTRKNNYLRANPKGAIAMGGKPGEGGGYLLKGDFIVEDDPNLEWLRKLAYHYEGQEQAEKDLVEWSKVPSVSLRLKIKRVIKVA